MQRLISLLLCLAPVAVFALEPQPNETSHAAVLVASDPAHIALTISSSTLECEPVAENDLTMEQMVIPGEGCYYHEGEPILPAVTRFVVVPSDKSVELVVHEGESRLIQAKLPLVVCDEKTYEEAKVDRDSEDSNVLIPPVTAEMSEPMVIRGVRLVRVTTYPVQFDPETETYLVRDKLEAELRFGDAEPVNPAFHPIRRNRSKTFLRFIQELAINGDVVGRDDPDYDVAPAYVGHYLVVVHDSVLQYAVPFIEWRRKSGYKVDILPVPADEACNPDWIKEHIQTIYDGYLDQGIDPFDLLMLIGDNDFDYGARNPAAQYILGTPNFGWDYACLEGGANDDNADVGLAQWIAGSESQMTLNTGRTLGYEMTPYFDNTDWFTRGAVFAQRWGANWHISLHTNVRWALEVMKMHGFDDLRFCDGVDEEGAHQLGGFMIEQFNDGVNLILGRSEAGPNWENVRPTGIYPIYINYGGHQDEETWTVMRRWDGHNLVGPVAATNMDSLPTTFSNNVMWLETINGLIQQDLPFGWARVNAVMAPELYIPNFPRNGFHRAHSASYGDPGLQPWLGVPKLVHAEYPARITNSTRRVEIRILRDENNEPFEGAQATLYFPGNMPAPDRAEYATYNQMFMQTQKSDADGFARFVFDDGTEFVNGTRMYVTVTGRDVNPSLDTCAIGVPAEGIELSSYELAEVEGNHDEYPNPGERFSFHITAKNTGNTNALHRITATVSSDSPYMEATGEQISLGDIEPGRESNGDHPVELRFSSDCPDGVSRPALRPTVLIEFSTGEGNWKSALRLETHAPHFEVNQIRSGAIIPDTSSRLEIEIVNVGSAPSSELTARVISLGMGVGVIRDQANYSRIHPGENVRPQGEPITIIGNKEAVPGTITPMQMILTDDHGFVDTVTFSLQVMCPRERSPQSPDAYGYYCYDDSDSGWFATPVYEWVEVDPRSENADFEGEQLGFDGQSPYDIGEAVVVDLPFVTRFYGMEFDKVTIATNGFITPGDQEEITNFQNWPLDRGIGGGAGMIAPFWDNLALGQTGKVYYFYDEENGRVIIEWSRLRHRYGSDTELTFETILFDPALRVSETGDPNILFQYKSIRNEVGEDDTWAYDAPYASVGISSPYGDTGINYTFNNQYPVTSAPLQNRCAILFTASPLRLTSYIHGRVTDASTAMGIPQVVVKTRHEYTALTDDSGYWSIANAPSGIAFDVTAHKIGYNDSTITDMEVAEFDTLEINFNLLHPEFTITDEHLDASLEPGQNIEIPFRLDNTGNGPLTWSAERCLPGIADAAPWTLRSDYAVGDTLDDDRIEGVIFVNNNFYVAGANGEDSSMIYVLDPAGSLIRQFQQPGHLRFGMRDLEWDGHLIWGSGERRVYGMTPQGELACSWVSPIETCNNIAYDPDRNLLWLAGVNTNIFGTDLEGNVVDTLNRQNLHFYGLSYWQDDPDGYGLYLTTNQDGDAPPAIYKMNTVTGDTIRVKNLELPVGANGIEGGFISNQFDPYSWVFMAIPNVAPVNGGDRIYVYQLEARKDWMELDSYGGLLQMGESHNFTLSLLTAGLPDTLFEGIIRFSHNADDNLMILNVALNVMGECPPAPFDLVAPVDGDTIQALPMHKSIIPLPPITFAWHPTEDPNDLDTVRYRLIMVVGDQSVRVPLITDTTLTVCPDSLGLPFSFGEPIIWWVEALSGGAEVASNTRFHLTVLPNSENGDMIGVPLSFDLKPVCPNPLNGRTTIFYSLDRSGPASLKLYDLTGRVALELFNGDGKIGSQKASLECAPLASGVYLLKLETDGRVKVQKVTLIR